VPARLPSLLAVACLATAGCGGDGDAKGAPKPRVDPARAADQLAVRCGLARPEPGAVPAIVPEGLLPPGSYIARARRTDSSARATILLPMGFVDAHATLSANAEKAGYSVIFSEQELLEAEVYMSSPGGLVKFRIYGSRLCPDSASQVLFERSYTEG
jgi:hypothetical protein